MQDRPIGVFDSGIGGLTVVKEIIKTLPNVNIVYFGDLARTPYGIKSKELIINYSFQIANFLIKECKVKMIIVACNTASSVAIDKLKEKFKIEIMGVIEPAVKQAVKVSKTQKIGVIGTSTTINSGIYTHLLKKINPRIEVYSQVCSLLVPLVEEGWLDNPITKQVVEIYLAPLKNKIDTLILGCTHYPLIRDIIQEVIGDKINIVDSATQVALQLKDYLKNLNKNKKEKRIKFYLTDALERFSKLANFILGEDILNEVEQISLEKL